MFVVRLCEDSKYCVRCGHPVLHWLNALGQMMSFQPFVIIESLSRFIVEKNVLHNFNCFSFFSFSVFVFRIRSEVVVVVVVSLMFFFVFVCFRVFHFLCVFRRIRSDCFFVCFNCFVGFLYVFS